MINLFRAEWQKIVGHTKLMISLVWLFPIMTAIVLSIGILISIFSEGFGAYMGESAWTNDLLGIWRLINAFPGNIFTRLPIIAFMAIVFAGEYEWGTWKNIVPRNQRLNLIIAKLVTLVIIVMLALIATSVITVIFQYLAHTIEGIYYGQKLTYAAVVETARIYFFEALLSSISLMIFGAFAAIAAMLTRSVIGSLLLSFGLSLVDLLSIMLFLILGNIFNKPELINLYSFSPSYNLENIRVELFDHYSEMANLPGFTADLSLGSSFSLLVIWIVALMSMAIWLFKRQDITT